MINTEWFKDRLKAIKLSQRQLAKKIGIDPAAVSNMLNNRRAMSMDEAKYIADVFGLPVTEVMRHAGIKITEDVRQVPVVGYIETDQVSLLGVGTHDMVQAPADMPRNSYALQLRGTNNLRDGWLYMVSGDKVPTADLIDKIAVTAVSDGRVVIGMIKRGYKAKTSNILLLQMHDDARLDNQTTAWSSQVLWIKPA